MVTASPAKLRDGSWGARVNGSVKVGDTVTIATKAGKSWNAKITKVVWSGDGVTLAATASASDYTPAVRNSRGYVTERGHEAGYCGYPCPVTGKKCCSKNGQCHDCI
jgi:hypothetical protein